MEHSISVLAGIGVLSIACQWFAWWVKLPAILFLLLAGLIGGPVLHWIQPDALFGDLLFPFISLAVAVILFEGSLTLKFSEIRGVEKVVQRFVSTGMVVTWLSITVATYLLLDFSWELSFLFGAVMVVTGPTVIIPMLRTVRPTARIANILRWEGIVIDPIGAFLAVLVFEFIISKSISGAWGHAFFTFGKMIAIGIATGVGAGYVLAFVMRRYWLPEFLHNVGALTLVFAVYGLSNSLQAESGLLSVTVMGIWLANARDVNLEGILSFKESLSMLLISGLFIILAARLDVSSIPQLGWSAIALFAIIQFVVRPLKVFVSTYGSKLTWQERALLAWIAPRGIVAAAVAAVFSIRLGEQHFAQAELLVPMVFLIIIGTVVLQSATAGLLARWLGVAEPEPKGFLVVGANPLARAIAKALEKKGFSALLTDVNWENIRDARMAGLRTYYGNAISMHADSNLDLIGIGKMLAITPEHDFNALSCLRYATEFGKDSVYTVSTKLEDQDVKKRRVSDIHPQQLAFSADVSFSKLSSLVSQGAEIRDTKLTESFDYGSYQKKYSNQAVPFFAIDPKGRLQVFRATNPVQPKVDWTIISLIPVDAEVEPQDKSSPSPATNVDKASPVSATVPSVPN